MLQSKARLLELNAKLAETLTSKGVEATGDETTTALVNKVANITSGGDDNTDFKNLIERNKASISIPNNVTRIGFYAFQMYNTLTSITIPNSVKSIDSYAFSNCSSLKSLTIPNSVKSIDSYAFNAAALTDLTIPNSVTNLTVTSFYYCTKLQRVTLETDFNCNNLNLSYSTLYTRETILQWLNALADRTGQTAYTLIIGATNLAKLTEEDILIATNKNWTLA